MAKLTYIYAKASIPTIDLSEIGQVLSEYEPIEGDFIATTIEVMMM